MAGYLPVEVNIRAITSLSFALSPIVLFCFCPINVAAALSSPLQIIGWLYIRQIARTEVLREIQWDKTLRTPLYILTHERMGALSKSSLLFLFYPSLSYIFVETNSIFMIVSFGLFSFVAWYNAGQGVREDINYLFE